MKHTGFKKGSHRLKPKRMLRLFAMLLNSQEFILNTGLATLDMFLVSSTELKMKIESFLLDEFPKERRVFISSSREYEINCAHKETASYLQSNALQKICLIWTSIGQ